MSKLDHLKQDLKTFCDEKNMRKQLGTNESKKQFKCHSMFTLISYIST